VAKVFITSLTKDTQWAPCATASYKRVLRAAKHNSNPLHAIVSEPGAADIILFVDAHSMFYFDIIRHPLYKKYHLKCFIFDGRDNTLPLIPGIYMDVPPSYNSLPIYCYGFYIRVFDNKMLDTFVPHSACEYLFSFVGKVSNNRKIRSAIVQIKHRQAFLTDSSSNQTDTDVEYIKILNKSKFVLCPRGFCPSTWRCFETMKAGRVPVIISDDWNPPPGLAWEEFSIRVLESAIEKIPELLESLEDRAEEMGQKARQAWLDNFSLECSFSWLVDRCLEIQPFIQKYHDFIARNRLPEVIRKNMTVDFVKDYIRNSLIK
jgi:hypothetical protein